MPVYRKSLMNVYKKFVVQMHDLSINTHHKEIMSMLNWNLEWKGFKFSKALDITMRKKRRLFEEILDAAEETEQESEEEEEEDLGSEDTETESEEESAEEMSTEEEEEEAT